MSSRNHNWKQEAHEGGEGVTKCNWIPIAAAVISAAGSYLASRQQAKAQERAAERTNEQQAQNMQPQMWGPAQPYAEGLLKDAKSLYQQQAFMPGVNPLQLLGRANALGYAEGLLPQHIGAAQASWRRGLDPGIDPYVSGMIRMAHRGMLEDYSRNILPQIAGRAQAVGGYGGSRQGVAQGIATEGLLSRMGDPMARAQNLQQYAALINPYTTIMSGHGGVAAPYQAGPSPWTAAMQGAGAGWSFGNMLNQQWGQNQNPTQAIGSTMQLGAAGPGTSGGNFLAQGVTGQPGSFL